MEATFAAFAAELDEKHDRWERLVKASRDVTVASKRLIFALLRGGAGQAKADAQYRDVCKLWRALDAELHSDADFWHYRRAFSPGAQEFVEAAALLVYLREGRLATRHEIEAIVHSVLAPGAADTPSRFRLTTEDYLLGVLDLTGEVMRNGLNAISGGDVATCQKALGFIRGIASFFQALALSDVGPLLGREAAQKLDTLRASVTKLETAIFRANLRLAELPPNSLPPAATLPLVADAMDTF